MALTDKLSAIGDAIREKTGGAGLLTLDAMPNAIRGISSSGGGSSADLRYVTFLSHDGAVEYGKKAVAVGDDCADPIARGVFSIITHSTAGQRPPTERLIQTGIGPSRKIKPCMQTLLLQCGITP